MTIVPVGASEDESLETVSNTQALNSSAANTVSVSAKSAILMCADSGEVIYEKNANEELAIASITKIMTAVIALEYIQVNDREIRFTSEMAAEGSSLYLQEGNVMKLSELVKGMMCVSGNDAANAIAIGIAGSKEAFAEKMNQKAKQLGMAHTHFVTPSGLDDEQHYSTAYDMALLCCYAMENEQFADIVSQKSLTVRYTSPENKQQYCKNHNRLLSLYEGCIGIKTGFTKKAGRTLTSCAERNGVRLIAVTLNAPDDWNDHSRLYDYGFSQTELYTPVKTLDSYSVPVVGGMSDNVNVSPNSDFSLTVIKDGMGTDGSDLVEIRLFMPHFVYAPIEKGSTVGEIAVFYKHKKITSVSLRAAETIKLQKEEC